MARPIIKDEDGLYRLLEGIAKDCHKDIKRRSTSARDAREVLDNLRVIFRD